MANQNNYKTDITEAQQSFIRFSVSRIVETPQDALIDMEVPAEFPNNLLNATVELGLYSLVDNTLIFYRNLNNIEPSTFVTKTLQYEDGSQRKFVIIDFTKFRDDTFPIGTFSLTLSFLVNELGSAEEPVLKVSRISPSRTEVELLITDTAQKQKMLNLVTPKITDDWIDKVLKQIFNQPIEDELPPTSPAKIDTESIQSTLGTTAVNLINKYGYDVDENERPGVYTVAQTVLDIAYPLAVEKVTEYLQEGNTFIDKETLLSIVNDALDQGFDDVYYEAETTPEKYRYNII